MTRKLLPIEPTEEMIAAGCARGMSRASVVGIYQDMLLAYGKKSKSPQMKFTEFLEQCAASGEPAISQYKPVLEYAASINLPESMLNLAWQEFKGHYSGATKKYSDWRKVFLNAVRGNWFGIWWINDAGEYALTTRGKQAAMNLKVGV